MAQQGQGNQPMDIDEDEEEQEEEQAPVAPVAPPIQLFQPVVPVINPPVFLNPLFPQLGQQPQQGVLLGFNPMNGFAQGLGLGAGLGLAPIAIPDPAVDWAQLGEPLVFDGEEEQVPEELQIPQVFEEPEEDTDEEEGAVE